MDEYLSKPFGAESLKRLLAEITRQSSLPEKNARKTTLPPIADPLALLTEQIGAEEARALANIWLEEAPARHLRLISCLKRGQTEAARKEAHALRGSSSIFGMRALLDASVAVENSIRANNHVAADLQEELSHHLQHSVAVLQRSVKAG
jgi:HPt (histidine-containing phosphotransfer) domain-containing protein